MSKLRVGILGLPNVGKSTLFNALTRSASAAAENYPFCTIDPNIGIAEVPDPHLPALAKITKTENILPAIVEFIDIAGLVKGASKGEGLGNKFLSHVREADALVQVVRFFQDPDITHVSGEINPLADKEIIETELLLADLESLTRQLEKAKTEAKSGQKDLIKKANLLSELHTHLSSSAPARTFTPPDKDSATILKSLNLLTNKRILYLANLAESDLETLTPATAAQTLQVSPDQVITLSAKLESELLDLSPQEATELLQTYNLTAPGLDTLALAAYRLLSLQTFYTAGPKEVRAWTIPAGATAPQAAGVIHTDFEKSFIRAEITTVTDFLTHQGWSGVRSSGHLRTEGKDYILQPEDVCYFLTSA